MLALAAGLAATPAAWANSTTPTTAERYAKVRRVCPPAEPGRATCQALVRSRVASAAVSAGARPYIQNDGAAGSGPSGGLTPAQLASAYGYEPTAGGSGQTVGIVDAFDDPDIEEDLGEFDKEYGLAECTTADGCFKKVGQTGSTTSLPPADTSGWSGEISLDVETVHSVCQKCKILLVEADSESDADLAAAVNEAVGLGATEVSNSYAGPEAGLGTPEQAAYDHPGVPIVAATGDEGYDDWTALNEELLPPGMPDAPASLPSVVAVGGTTLELTAGGARASETVWNDEGRGDETPSGVGATGGGCSTLFTAQPWQREAPGFAATGCGTARLAADVSADADPFTGFDVYDSDECGTYCAEGGLGEGWATIGGTSLSTPIIAALYALAGGGQGVEYPALTLYGHLAGGSSLYDVTEGGNGYCDGESSASCGDPNSTLGSVVDCEGTTACNAAPGFDGPSGVGTPDGLGLFKPLLPTAVITPPASLTEGSPASFSAGKSSDPYPGGSISSYSWSWGDASANSSGPSPSHTFAASGTYPVTLTVTDNYGLSSSPSTQSVTVSKGSHEEEEANKKHEEEAAAEKKHEEEETAANKQLEEAAANKAHEEEAAAAKRREEEAAAAAAKKHEEEKPALVSGVQGVAGFQVTGAPPVPDAKLASTALAASTSGALTIKVSCPAGESSCSGTVALRTLDAVSASAGRAAKAKKAKKAILTLASGSFSVAGGKTKTVTLHLSAKARALLSRTHSLRVRATIVAHDPSGATHTTQAVVTLRAPRARRGKG
jgi:PKD repeat protein